MAQYNVLVWCREACALGAEASVPCTPVEAQYSVTWPVACALVDGDCGPQHSDATALTSAPILKVLGAISMVEVLTRASCLSSVCLM